MPEIQRHGGGGDDVVFHDIEYPTESNMMFAYDKNGYTPFHRAVVLRLNKTTLFQLFDKLNGNIFQLTRIPIVDKDAVEEYLKVKHNKQRLDESDYAETQRVISERLSILQYYINHNNSYYTPNTTTDKQQQQQQSKNGADTLVNPSNFPYENLNTIGSYKELNIFTLMFNSKHYYPDMICDTIAYINQPQHMSKKSQFYQHFKTAMKYISKTYPEYKADCYWVDYTTHQNILMTALTKDPDNVDLIRYITQSCVISKSSKRGFFSSLFSSSTTTTTTTNASSPPQSPVAVTQEQEQPEFLNNSSTSNNNDTANNTNTNDIKSTITTTTTRDIDYFHINANDKTQDGAIALHYAILYKCNSQIITLLLKYYNTSSINLCTASSGQPPLFMAVSSKQWGTALELIKHGADVNFADPHGRVALHIALKDPTCPDDVIIAILNAGASVLTNPKHASSRTALMAAVEFNRSRDIIHLIIAIGEKQKQKLSSWSNKQKLNSNKQTWHKNDSAINQYNYNVHYINVKDKFGMSALTMASSSHYISFDTIKALFEYGSKEQQEEQKQQEEQHHEKDNKDLEKQKTITTTTNNNDIDMIDGIVNDDDDDNTNNIAHEEEEEEENDDDDDDEDQYNNNINTLINQEFSISNPNMSTSLYPLPNNNDDDDVFHHQQQQQQNKQKNKKKVILFTNNNSQKLKIKQSNSILDPNNISIGGWNALTHALRAKGGYDIIKYLLEHGVSPNQYDSDYHTPFIVALQYHCTCPIIKLFLDGGSNIYQYYGLPFVGGGSSNTNNNNTTTTTNNNNNNNNTTWIDNDTDTNNNDLIAQQQQQQQQQNNQNNQNNQLINDDPNNANITANTIIFSRKDYYKKLRLFTPIMFIIKKGQLRPDINTIKDDPLEDILELIINQCIDDIILQKDQIDCLKFLEQNICLNNDGDDEYYYQDINEVSLLLKKD